MRGQAEIIVFMLLFIIGVIFFSSATVWGRDIFQENVDFTNMESAEKFAKDLDNGIGSVIRFGGVREFEYPLDGTIELVDNHTIDIRTPVSLEIQQNWVNISEGSSYIMEKKEGEDLVLRLIYPKGDYEVFIFTDSSRMSSPSYVRVEKNSTESAATTVIKIRITFV